MTRPNIKMTNGYNGGLISSFIILLLLVSCSQDIIKCQYKFYSLATGNEVRKDFFLTIEESANKTRFNYCETIDSVEYYYEIDDTKNTLKIVDYVGQDDITTLVGEKSYQLNGTPFVVKCFWANNEDKLAENLLLFYNQDFGVFLLKYTSSVTELTYFDGETQNVRDLISVIKKDSVFYHYGGRKIPDPPSL